MRIKEQSRRAMEVSLKLAVLMLMIVAAANGDGEVSRTPAKVVRVKKGTKYCTKWECAKLGGSKYCCNLTITDFFDVYQFEELFPKRNTPVAHAVDFWDYHSFILASSTFQPEGFCTTGGKKKQMLELAAFLGHVGSRTSCGYGVATGGPLAWGLCYRNEMSPSQAYCDETDRVYPCALGAQYYGRGALPLYWSFNYGYLGEKLKIDLLNHPEYLEQNATIAFQAAMWMWMNPWHKGLPSPHAIFTGDWKPTKNDTLEKRVPGFGTTINALYGDQMCGKGDDESMSNIVSHYLYYLDLLGVGREAAGTNLTCAEQKPFHLPTRSSL